MSYLVGNYSIYHKSWGSYLAGATTSTTIGNKRDKSFGRDLILFEDNRTGFPRGYGGSSFIIPLETGGLSSRFQSSQSSVSASLPLGIPLDSSITASADASATLALIVNLEAALTASGLITDAQLAIIAQMTASISASGTVTTADLGNILNMAAGLSANGTLTTTDLITLINMSADISNAADGLTAAGISTELLDSQDIETGYSMREALRIILSAVGGKVSGAETTTITFRNVTDDKDRIVATVDANGNRSAVTLDVS